MPDSAIPKSLARRVKLSPSANNDLAAVLRWSTEHFGPLAAERYQSLLIQALRDIGDDPTRVGSQASPKLARNARLYHLDSSRTRVAGDRVKSPRHLIVYRVRKDGAIEIARILHDEQSLELHLPRAYRNKE